MVASRSNEQFREGSTPVIHLQLYRKTKNGSLRKISYSELNTLTLTYFNQSTGAVINSRSAQDVKNANDIAVTADCGIIWELTSSDTACIVTTIDDDDLEKHIALFKWALNDGMKGSTRVPVYVIRDSKV